MALFKDIFYPDNPKRRDKVVRKYQEILDCMKDNFNATNKLAEYMKQNYDVKSGVGKIVHSYNELTVKEGITIKENCDMFLKETEKLQNAVALVSKFRPQLRSLLVCIFERKHKSSIKIVGKYKIYDICLAFWVHKRS